MTHEQELQRLARWEKESAALEERIGYHFADKSLLRTALTHSSYQNEQKGRAIVPCNERMEFLGDSVLSLIVSREIYARFPAQSEGELSVLRSNAVCTEALCGYAQKIGLGKALLLGNGEEHTGGREKPRTLENAFEALVAALYLDGGPDTAEAFALPFLTEKIGAIRNREIRDYKTRLQMIVQQEPDAHLEYILVGESGPAHQRVFEIEARINSNLIGHGFGSSKRAAAQAAAKEALRFFGENDE